MEKKNLIKLLVQIVLALLIGLGVALTAKGEEFAENGWAVALITAVWTFGFIELGYKLVYKNAFQWKYVLLNVALTMVSYFVTFYVFLK